MHLCKIIHAISKTIYNFNSTGMRIVQAVIVYIQQIRTGSDVFTTV